MEHSKLVPLAILKKEKLPIIRIAKLVINFYRDLAVLGNHFNQINIVSEKGSLHKRIDVHEPNASQYLADEILHQNVDDIRKINKIDNPDINFSRDDMISFGLEAKVDGETLITLNYSFSTKLPRIGSIVVNSKCFDTFEKANLFLKAVEKSFPIDYSVIKISDRVLNKVTRGYKAPIGWVTYFSNDYELQIPDDLEGIEYEHTDKGKYLILTREEITTDSQKLEENKQKLLDLMEEIKRRVPVYRRRNSQDLI